MSRPKYRIKRRGTGLVAQVKLPGSWLWWSISNGSTTFPEYRMTRRSDALLRIRKHYQAWRATEDASYEVRRLPPVEHVDPRRIGYSGAPGMMTAFTAP